MWRWGEEVYLKNLSFMDEPKNAWLELVKKVVGQ